MWICWSCFVQTQNGHNLAIQFVGRLPSVSSCPLMWLSARVDTLNGSRHANMKELRFTADGGVWRVAFAFDPKRKAILLVAGDKSGISERRFYKQLIKKAGERFDTHLDRLKKDRRSR